MPTHPFRSILAACAMPLIFGCAPNGEFPSLAPRAIESQVDSEVPVRLPPAVASDPQLLSRIAALLAEAREGHQTFEAILPEARAEVARAGAAGSESWIEAQEAISRLEAVRAPTVTALAQLDLLAIDRAAQATNEEDFAALLAAVDAASALARQQREIIDRLRAALNPI